jgi:amino acid transporter
MGLLFAIPETTADLLAQNTTALDYYIIGGNSSSSVVNLYVVATGEKVGLFLTILLVILLFFAGMSSVTVTSRITFAMARDGAFPGSKVLYHVSPRTKSPMRTVLLVFIVDAILLCLQAVNTSAFTAIISLTTIGFQISYAIPIWLRVTDARKTFQQGSFSLGKLSIPMGWISASWLTFTSILFFWPSVFPVAPDNMNYTVAVVGGVFIIAILFWIVSARHWFVGPKRPDGEQVSTVEISQMDLPEITSDQRADDLPTARPEESPLKRSSSVDSGNLAKGN